MKRLVQFSGAAFALLSTSAAVPCFAKVNQDGPITDAYGQTVQTGQEYYDTTDVNGNSYFILPEISYSDAGYVYSQFRNYEIYEPALNVNIMLQPNFENVDAWANAPTGYNIPELWGQCTWFTWCRFYEIYGFDPGFTGDGWQCASQLVNAHPDQFELSTVPVSGAVFSSSPADNHVGIVLWSDGYNMIIQEGNLDGGSNPDFNEATQDYWTRQLTLDQLHNLYDGVVFANPIQQTF